jgi:polar amino acid transport system ATP-binding protein
MNRLPVVDLRDAADTIADRIGTACRAHGFFYVVVHGVDERLCTRLGDLSRRFFALPDDVKSRWAMSRGGRAWRGWFPLGGELTSGRPDWKEGLYLGVELPAEHPRVRAGVPLHGPNLIPGDDVVPGVRAAILDYIDAVTPVGHAVLAHIARSLALPADYFASRYTADPLVLFRIFDYPSRPVPAGSDVQHGVGEHTDYGLLTLLRQDDVGGLQVRTASGWIEAPPLARSFVCNIGDMLDRMTGGFYRSTPHRVRLNTSGRDRLSFPLFLDPDFEARIEPIRSVAIDDRETRWDRASVHAFDGTYGDYVLGKVGKVFPELRRDVL